MKVLYGIQCTGNGHITRSIELIRELRKHVRVDVLTSGGHSEIQLPFDVKYKCSGLTYNFGTNGSFDLWKTLIKNSLPRFIREIRTLPADQYDLIISDFEPITAWSALVRNTYIVSISNQAALLSKHVPTPKTIAPLSKLIIRSFCPGKRRYGLHYRSTGENIFSPPIRIGLKNITTTDDGFYLVYLPFFGDQQIIQVLQRFSDIKWRVFSKHALTRYKLGNISIEPVNGATFDQALAACSGIFCAAGFGLTSEALFLNKKLLVIPMRNQYEQKCNAYALKKMGVPVIRTLRKSSDAKMRLWLEKGSAVDSKMHDERQKIVQTILTDFALDLHGRQHLVPA